MNELLQKRLRNRIGDQASKLANPEISMAPFGSFDTSADVQAMRDLASQTKGAEKMYDVEIDGKNFGFGFDSKPDEASLNALREF